MLSDASLVINEVDKGGFMVRCCERLKLVRVYVRSTGDAIKALSALTNKALANQNKIDFKMFDTPPTGMGEKQADLFGQ